MNVCLTCVIEKAILKHQIRREREPSREVARARDIVIRTDRASALIDVLAGRSTKRVI